jgi:hypothetical protein
VVEEEQLPVRLQLTAGNEDTTDVTGLDTDENGPNTVNRRHVQVVPYDGPVGLFLPAGPGRYAGPEDRRRQPDLAGRQCAVCSLRRHADRLRGRGCGRLCRRLDRQVFTVELNHPADGQYRFTLLDNLDHHAVATAFDVENIIGINLNNRVRSLTPATRATSSRSPTSPST